MINIKYTKNTGKHKAKFSMEKSMQYREVWKVVLL